MIRNKRRQLILKVLLWSVCQTSSTRRLPDNEGLPDCFFPFTNLEATANRRADDAKVEAENEKIVGELMSQILVMHEEMRQELQQAHRRIIIEGIKDTNAVKADAATCGGASNSDNGPDLPSAHDNPEICLSQLRECLYYEVEQVRDAAVRLARRHTIMIMDLEIEVKELRKVSIGRLAALSALYNRPKSSQFDADRTGEQRGKTETQRRASTGESAGAGIEAKFTQKRHSAIVSSVHRRQSVILSASGEEAFLEF